MNSPRRRPQVYFRSLATRGAGSEVPERLADVVTGVQGGRLRPGDRRDARASARATPPSCRSSTRSLYVMTPEFGAASPAREDRHARLRRRRRHQQVRAPRRRGRAARRAPAAGPQPRGVRHAARRHAGVRHRRPPRFNDDGVTALYQHLRDAARPSTGLAVDRGRAAAGRRPRRPPAIRRSMPAGTGSATWPRSPRRCAATTPHRRRWPPAARRASGWPRVRGRASSTTTVATAVDGCRRAEERSPRPTQPSCSTSGRRVVEAYSGDEQVVQVRDKEIRTALTREIAVRQRDPPGRAAPLHRRRRAAAVPAPENLPGRFPFTAGVFPFKRDGEDPARMFAGEGDAFRTNRRFKLPVGRRPPATRLSTAFDSVTLYGRDPDSGPTSTARSAPPACRSPRSTT